jgi:hypothetical protein
MVEELKLKIEELQQRIIPLKDFMDKVSNTN